MFCINTPDAEGGVAGNIAGGFGYDTTGNGGYKLELVKYGAGYGLGTLYSFCNGSELETGNGNEGQTCLLTLILILEDL